MVEFQVYTACGRGRIVYCPDWSRSKPWCTYENGTATNSFPQLNLAMARLREHGFRFTKTYTEYLKEFDRAEKPQDL